MEIPHEVEELILAFVGLKRKPRCLAQTKTGKICKRRTGNKWILCAQHMRMVNQQPNIGISPMFVNLCLQITQAIRNVEQYQQGKRLRERTKGKTYHPSLDHYYHYWTAPAGHSAPFNYVVSTHS